MEAVSFQHLDKSFGAVAALRDVTFAVTCGESHAIVGENGAGKSTLLNILAGSLAPDRGHPRVANHNFFHRDHAGPPQRRQPTEDRPRQMACAHTARADWEDARDPIIDSGVDVVTAANVDQYVIGWKALEKQ